MTSTSARSTTTSIDTKSPAGDVRAMFDTDLGDLRAREAELAGALDAAPPDEHDARLELEYQLAATRLEISDVEAALQSLDEGSYGACVECGQTIGPERLEALPETTLCVSCAS